MLLAISCIGIIECIYSIFLPCYFGSNAYINKCMCMYCMNVSIQQFTFFVMLDIRAAQTFWGLKRNLKWGLLCLMFNYFSFGLNVWNVLYLTLNEFIMGVFDITVAMEVGSWNFYFSKFSSFLKNLFIWDFFLQNKSFKLLPNTPYMYLTFKYLLLYYRAN